MSVISHPLGRSLVDKILVMEMDRQQNRSKKKVGKDKGSDMVRAASKVRELPMQIYANEMIS